MESVSNISDKPGRGYQRTLRALGLFAETSDALTLDEVSERLAIPRSTMWLILQHLLTLGYVEMVDDRRFAAGPSLTLLSLRVVGRIPLRAAARDALEALCRNTGLDTYLGQLIGGEPVLIDHLVGANSIHANNPLGVPIMWHCATIGQTMLAFGPRDIAERVLAEAVFPGMTPATLTTAEQLRQRLREARQKGYVIAYEEVVPGVGGIALPVFSRDKELAGGVVVHGTVEHLRENEARLVKGMRAAVSDIERQMGRPGTPIV